MKNKALLVVYSVVPICLLLLAWEYLFTPLVKDKYLFGVPSLIWRALVENTKNGVLLKDSLLTSTETFCGFIAGNLAGTIIGLSLWFSRRVAFIARPYILVLGTIPVFAVAPLMIIWFGIGLSSKITIVAISTISLAITQSYRGAQNVEKNYVLLFRSFGANRLQIFFKLLLPSSFSWVFSSLKLNVGFSIAGAFIAEYISSENGLAHRIFKAAALYDTPLVFAAIIYLILIAVFFNLLIGVLQRRVLPHLYVQREGRK